MGGRGRLGYGLLLGAAGAPVLGVLVGVVAGRIGGGMGWDQLANMLGGFLAGAAAGIVLAVMAARRLDVPALRVLALGALLAALALAGWMAWRISDIQAGAAAEASTPRQP